MRAKPTNLVMGEPVPYGQTYHYHTGDPLDEVLTDGYFMPVRHYLRRGDSIRITRLEGERVEQLVEVIVTYSSGPKLEIAKLGKVMNFAPVPEEAAEVNGIKTSHEGIHVKQGFGCFQVRNINEKVLAEFPSRKDAEAYKAELEAG